MKMTQKTQFPRRTYGQIYFEVGRLSLEVEETRLPSGFDKYLERINSIQRKYIGEFDGMDDAERQNASLLINMVLSQMHGKLDIFRAKVMRGELKPRK
ncbi:hypothetical protein J4408_01260 [Candidatus Pacearchaeota archaeon]|nr:hypothetical protein [Candidatus Pacearchaeota archaeon]